MSRQAVGLRWLKPRPLDVPLAFFLLSAILGVGPSYDRSLSWTALGVLGAGVLLALVLSRLTIDRRWWRAGAGALVLVSAVLALYFILQYPHFAYTGKVGLIDWLGTLIGRVVPAAPVWVPRRNSVATFLEGPLFLAAALALAAERRAGRTGWGATAGAMGLALLLTASRGAWLAVFVAGTIWLAVHWRPARWGLVTGGVVALGLVVYVVVRGEITALGDLPLIDRTLAPLFIRPDRLEIYRNSVYLLQDFPLTGLGMGDAFAMVLSRYALLIQVPFLFYSHNLYLQIWLEQGVLGAAALLGLMVVVYQTALERGEARADLGYQATWVGLTAILFHGLTDARQTVDLWCWVPFFVLLGLNAASVARSNPAPARARWLVPAGAVGLFLLVVTVALWPLPGTWHANRGSVLQARGELAPDLDDAQRAACRVQAIDHYRRALRAAPGDRTAHQRLGLLAMDEGQFDEAVSHLEAALEATPGNTTTRKALGLAYVWVGELDRAQVLLEEAPGIVEELNAWGWWRQTQGETELALNAYRISLMLAPDQPEVRRALERLEQGE
jgi:O-antigen ligase